jgi:carboxypeptidase PM20D1
MRRPAFAAILATIFAAGTAHAQTPGPNPQAEAQALELLKRGIAFKTVTGEGNETFQYATYLKEQLVAGGFADEDVTITKLEDTAYMVARYRGTGKAKNGAKPIYISGHMDVVAANPKDWQRDPFTPVIENGYIFGRGATDMKYDLSTMIATLIQLKREGYKPARDLVLLASGDEESQMKTTKALAEQNHDGELLLNVDGGGGSIGDDGKPLGYGIDGAEKSYADFELTFTNPGGHSSAPRPSNAIYELAHALTNIGNFYFPGQVNDITRASLTAQADSEDDPATAAAIRAFLKDQNDAAALAALRARPGYIGQIGTTCVATELSGGHAPNALPQRATANINCRIFPGVDRKDVMAKLAEVAGDPKMTIREIEAGALDSPASPLRPDVMNAVSKAIHARFPGVKVVPGQSSGASDSMYFRARGIPSYGISPIFMKGSDSFSHGLNERTPLSEIAPSIVYYKSVLKDLAK